MDKGNVLVTGGAGFIGSHTCVALAEAGYTPIIVDDFRNSKPFIPKAIAQITNHSVEVHQIDVTDRVAVAEVLARYGSWAGIIHFAAYKAVGESVAHPIKYYRNNIDSLLALLEATADAGAVRMVFSSSCTVYGEPDEVPVTEAAPVKPATSPYGYTKQVCEQILTDHQKAHPQCQSVLLRYFNPIGAHPSGKIGELPIGKPDNLVPYVTQTAAGWRDKLTIFGDDYPTPDGTCIRDYIHVMDLAEAHVKALDRLVTAEGKAQPAIFNIGTGSGHSVMEVVKTFEEVTGVPVPHTIGDRRPGDVTRVFADAEKAKTILGWEAHRSLADALRDAWHWQQKLPAPEPS